MRQPERKRTANLLGALALRLADEMATATDRAAGRGAAAPAALTALTRERTRLRATIQYLREVLGLSHPATVRVVDRLSDDGLVERRPGPDGRTVAPVLTAAGAKAAQRVARARADVLAARLDVLTAEEGAQLTGLLDKLLAAEPHDVPDGQHLCRLCDLDACYRGGDCPVDRVLGLER